MGYDHYQKSNHAIDQLLQPLLEATTPDDIFKYLAKRDVKGLPKNPQHCAVSEYMKQELIKLGLWTPEYMGVYTGSGGMKIYNDRFHWTIHRMFDAVQTKFDVARPYESIHPISHFISLFDGLKYPRLIHDDDRGRYQGYHADYHYKAVPNPSSIAGWAEPQHAEYTSPLSFIKQSGSYAGLGTVDEGLAKPQFEAYVKHLYPSSMDKHSSFSLTSLGSA